jgi:hypothetical protein
MADSLVATDFDFSFDVLCNITAQVTFDRVVLIDEVPHTNDLFVGQIANAGC